MIISRDHKLPAGALFVVLALSLGLAAPSSSGEPAVNGYGRLLSPAAVGPLAFVKGSKRLIKVRIERDVQLADEAMLKGKYAEAADLYRHALSRNAKNVPAMVGLGMALAKEFKLDGAESELDKALELAPGNAAAHCGKAMVLINRLQSSSATIIKARESTLNQAEAEAKQAISIDPGMPEAHYNLGMVYKEQGRLDEAASEFQQAQKYDPKYPDAFAGLGMVRLYQGRLGEAQECFKRAIQLNPGNSTAHYGLGQSLIQQGRVDEALKELNTALYQYPNSAPTREALGEAYEKQGNTVAAIKEYRESLRIKPENAGPYLHIADIREGRGDLELSLAELRSGLELAPNNPQLHQRIADECLRLGKLDDAIKDYQATLNLSPGEPAAIEGLTRSYYLKAEKETGGAFIASNDYELAERQIQQAIALRPDNMELRLAEAKLRALSGKPVDLSAIGQPRSDGERIAYAEALLAQNQFQEANTQMNMVLASAANARQTFAVADLALMIKDLDSAEAGYKKAAIFPGGEERAKRGLAQVQKARETARQDLTLANDLARKRQVASAVDKYHFAVYGNPKDPDSRIGLAKALEKLTPAEPKNLREAVLQYRAYIALSPDLPVKEKEKLQKHMANLESKAYKLELKAKNRAY